MLRIMSRRRGTRRELLRIGAAAVGGLTLPGLLAARAAVTERRSLRDRSVVVLNLQGGPSQFETFDPNMAAPREIRSITGEVATSLPGVTFGGSLPQIAARAERLAVIRSYRHGISSHGPAAMHVMAGGNPTGASMGCLLAGAAGLTNPRTGMPSNVLVTAAAAGPDYDGLYANVDRVSQTGTLPAAYKPFDPSAGGEVIANMRLQLNPRRLDDRRSLLGRLDRLRRQLDADDRLAAADRFQQQAYDVLVRGVADAFDVAQEDPQTVARYDTGQFASTEAVKRRNRYAEQFSPIALGKQMLLARRLCEAGCGFVTVTCGGWDMHGGGKEFTMSDGIATLTPAVDRAVSAFLDDVAQRGLAEQILLVITGEFGRTPRINKNGGRDHWGNLCTLAFAGGGLRMGQVVGRSDRNGAEPASPPVSSGNVLATIMQTLFDVGQLRLDSGVPREIAQVITAGEPIAELV